MSRVSGLLRNDLKKLRHSIDVGNVTTYTLLGLKQGVTYYIALTAYDSSITKVLTRTRSLEGSLKLSAPLTYSVVQSGETRGILHLHTGFLLHAWACPAIPVRLDRGRPRPFSLGFCHSIEAMEIDWHLQCPCQSQMCNR